MLIVDGYKMVDGTATVQFSMGSAPIEVSGVFLYRPDIDLWTVAPCSQYPWGGTFTRDEIKQIKERGQKA